MKNLQSYLGNFDFYLGKSSELPAEPLSADEPSQVASTVHSIAHCTLNNYFIDAVDTDLSVVAAR